MKFQSFHADKLFSTPETVKKLKNLEIAQFWYEELLQFAENHDIMLFFSVFDEESVETLEKIGNPIYKVASYELMHFPLLEKISMTHKPIILSTGMADGSEVGESVEYVRSKGVKDIILLHCVSQYPTKYEDVNLKTISALRNFNVPVGFSDHSLSIYAPIAAVSLGANVIEKHFTLDRKMEGPDHFYALVPSELKEMINGIREVEKMLGTETICTAASEITEREWRRAIYAKKYIKKGKVIQEEDIIILRPSPEGALSPKHVEDLKGKKTVKNIKKGNLITWESLR